MKTPEEIKKGLRFCTKPDNPVLNKCEFCVYGAVPGCENALKHDTLAYILQLEHEKTALLDSLKEADVYGECGNCAHYKYAVPEGCDAVDCECYRCEEECACKTCEGGSNWEWKGIQGGGEP